LVITIFTTRSISMFTAADLTLCDGSQPKKGKRPSTKFKGGEPGKKGVSNTNPSDHKVPLSKAVSR
jgi:hypothetical protein